MNMDVPPIGAAGRAGVPGPARVDGPGRSGFDRAVRSAAASDDIPASPPPAVMREVDAASLRAEWMRENGYQLHFEVDPNDQRVRVEVRDLEGRLIRVVPPSEGLAIATGGPLDAI